MIKNLKIISLFFLTSYIQSSENNSTNPIPAFLSAIQLERYIQTLPAKDRKDQRNLYLKNEEIFLRFTSYYRDLAYNSILIGTPNSFINILMTSEFPREIYSIGLYNRFMNLLLFEINHQIKILRFITEYPTFEYSKEKFIENFTKEFKEQRSEKRFNKELEKAFINIEYREPLGISYFFDPNSSDKPLYPLSDSFLLSKIDKYFE